MIIRVHLWIRTTMDRLPVRHVKFYTTLASINRPKVSSGIRQTSSNLWDVTLSLLTNKNNCSKIALPRLTICVCRDSSPLLLPSPHGRGSEGEGYWDLEHETSNAILHLAILHFA